MTSCRRDDAFRRETGHSGAPANSGGEGDRSKNAERHKHEGQAEESSTTHCINSISQGEPFAVDLRLQNPHA